MILQIDYQNRRETGDAANLFFTSMPSAWPACSRGDGKRQIKKLAVNDSNDNIHPYALLPNGLSMI